MRSLSMPRSKNRDQTQFARKQEEVGHLSLTTQVWQPGPENAQGGRKAARQKSQTPETGLF